VQRGDISNQAAPALVFDFDLLFHRKGQSFWTQAFVSPIRAFQPEAGAQIRLDELFRAGYRIVVVARKEKSFEKVMAALLDDWSVTDFWASSDIDELRETARRHDVAVFFVSPKFPASVIGGKAVHMDSWMDVYNRVGTRRGV
jgi:hypothetical protein